VYKILRIGELLLVHNNIEKKTKKNARDSISASVVAGHKSQHSRVVPLGSRILDTESRVLATGMCIRQPGMKTKSLAFDGTI